MRSNRIRLTLAFAGAAFLIVPASAPASGPAPEPARTGANAPYVMLSWNDLGMHCMNQWHHNFSILPPFNNVFAQLIRVGDAQTSPALATSGATIEYSFPGNTTSVTKTDFWTYAPALFNVQLAPDIGLTGKGLTGTLDLEGTHYVARGIPITPWPDATPTVEHPFQQAQVIARGNGGVELARSTPVAPVSAEIGCVGAGCHASESAILHSHESVTGYNAAATPILCAACHADPALGTTGRSDAGYFSLRIHAQHAFLDQQLSGTAVCYLCHPGPSTRCLRGTMSQTWGLVCQDCHGNMATMASSIENGRIPWVNEPSCGKCHSSRFTEPSGTLFKNSAGHGGVMCEGCHNSTHADVPSREAADNANNLALQGRAGPLSDCAVCHGTVPAGAGPHGMISADVAAELLAGGRPLALAPNPARHRCTIDIRAGRAEGGTLLVHDAQGRVVRLLRAAPAGAGRLRAAWDLRGRDGTRVPHGVYFVRWLQDGGSAAGRLTVLD